MKKMYKVVALAGKAGSGKDTILKKVIAAVPDRFHEIISCTTRPPREGEVDGVNYHFVNDTSFIEKIMDDSMLEWTMFNGWYYGTPTSSLVEDKVNIGVFNPAGLRSLTQSPQVNLSIISVEANDKLRLLRQLNREENPNVKEIVRRFSTDEEDFRNFYHEFENLVIVNEQPIDLDFAVDVIVDEAERLGKCN